MNKIALLGNCQTKALSWYINRLPLNIDVRFICMYAEFPNKTDGWCEDSYHRGEYISVITDLSKSIEFLKEADFIIYQHIKPETTKYFNYMKIQEYKKQSCKLISISSFVYDEDSPETLIGMKERAIKFNINIPAHKILETHSDVIKKLEDKRHPNVYYLLEVVRQICKIANWNFYNDINYNYYIKRGYPWG